MQTDLGVTGAKRASWHDGYRAVILELHESHPNASPERLAELLVDKIESDPDLLLAVAVQVVANTLQSLHDGRKRTHRAPQIQQSDIVAAAGKIAEQILLLNMEMPNGKRLRYCSGDYVAKLGGGLAKAGKKAGHKLMGQVFDEKTLRAIVGQ